ncbi:MAG: hypothetical protein JXJ22_12490 [Bacteroidales bacterium]|nr:hypothetical protein [Bacteroidales bacterium]
MRSILLILFIFINVETILFSQSAPADDENIPFLVTFGADSKTSWGDDDFCQIFFFIVPSAHTDPVYIRIFDPETGNNYDENKGEFNTVISYKVYGGNKCWSEEAAQGTDQKGNYNSGILLASKSFGSELQYDNNWYTLGPFNPFEGEYVEKFNGRVFKIIAQGVSGDDGNLYKYFLSINPDKNIEVEGGNIFTYEYTFRLANDVNHVSQIYPFVDDKTISIEVSNFDWDNDGIIRIISVAKNGILCNVSNEDNWVVEEFPIIEEEKNTTVEIQFIKNQKMLIKNNNVAIVVKNQYGISLPFFVVPIGGIPVYSPKIRMKGIR